MTETASIYKGDTAGPWRVAAPLDDGTLPALPGAYTCKIKVAGTAIERSVTDIGPDDDGTANRRFLAALTPTETATLAAGQYVVAIEIENTGLTPPLRVETHIILTVSEQVIGSDYVPTLPDTLGELRADLAAVNAAIRKIVAGEMVKEVWRDGRRIVRENPSYDMLMRHKAELERKIEEEGNLAEAGKRRRPIRLIYA